MTNFQFMNANQSRANIEYVGAIQYRSSE